jgi:hypothetical protein
MAVVDGAFVFIFAIYRSINDSLLCIAGSDGACIRSLDWDSSIDAMTGSSIASSGSASIFVVTSVEYVFAFSIYAAISSAFVIVIAFNLSMDTSL